MAAGRFPYSITFRTTSAELARLDRLAEALGVSRSDALRIVAKRGLRTMERGFLPTRARMTCASGHCDSEE